MNIEDNKRSAVFQRRLDRLRQEFDASFAEPIAQTDTRIERLLCFTAGGAKFAIPMAGLQAVAHCSSVTSVPSRVAALLGLTVVRAQILPVYSITHLTGIGEQSGTCHWLAILRGASPVALAIDTIEGYASDTALETAAGDLSGLVSGIIRHGNDLFAALRAPEIYQRITSGNSGQGKDRK